MIELTRRHIVAGAVAAIAVAATPKTVVAEGEEAVAVTYMDPVALAWRPDCFYSMRQLVTVAGQWRVVMLSHVSEDVPSERFLSRPLFINENGRFEEEPA